MGGHRLQGHAVVRQDPDDAGVSQPWKGGARCPLVGRGEIQGTGEDLTGFGQEALLGVGLTLLGDVAKHHVVLSLPVQRVLRDGSLGGEHLA